MPRNSIFIYQLIFLGSENFSNDWKTIYSLFNMGTIKRNFEFGCSGIGIYSKD